MRKALFLFNPHAGKGKINSGLSTVIDLLTKSGFLVTTYPTQARGDAVLRIKQWGEDYDRVVVAGGDGMLHEAVNGIMALEKKPDLGYIPTGTVNDFAVSNAIPKALARSAQVAAADHTEKVDLGRFNGEYFSYVAAFGAVTDVPYTTDQGAKNTFGFLAYLFNAAKYMDMRTLFGACRQITITTDGGIIDGEFLLGCISNSRSIGSLKQILPKDVRLDDGLLEGLFIRKPANLLELNNVLNALLVGNLKAKNIVSVKSARFDLEFGQEAAWTLDGEDGSVHKNVSISACRQCLPVLLP